MLKNCLQNLGPLLSRQSSMLLPSQGFFIEWANRFYRIIFHVSLFFKGGFSKTLVLPHNNFVCRMLSPLWATSHLFKEESQVIRDESKDHGSVDESSLEQQICELADYTLIVKKNWSPRPSATGSYSRQAGSPVVCETKSS